MASEELRIASGVLLASMRVKNEESADEPKASADSLEPEEQLTSGEPISSLMPDGSICFCPFAGDAAVFSYYGSTGTCGGRETIRPSGSSWSPSSSNTTPLHSRLQPWSG